MKISIKDISILLNSISLVLPCFVGAPGFFGLLALLLGWIGIFESNVFLGLPWLANFFYLFVLVFYKTKWIYKLMLSILGIVFGLFAFGINKIPADESGTYYTVSVGIGFFFWMSSFVLVIIYLLKIKKVSPNNHNAHHP